jgi:hypothetical protein
VEKAFGTIRKTLRSDLALATIIGWGAAVTFASGQAQAFPPEDPPCPTKVLAPNGLNPKANIDHCEGKPNCLVSFKRYQWWTAYQFPFFNGGLHTPFAPEHAFLGGDGHLHLRAAADVNLGAGVVWSGAEAVLMFHDDGSEANLGHGNYLVTARLVGGTWNNLDPNMAFGVFTYERPATGPTPNTAREIDLAEISRWGWNHKTPVDCPFNGFSGDPKNQFPNAVLCRGSAQFALQSIGQGDANQAPLMVDRYVSAMIMRSRL